mmetsp:Transcript_15829/g.32426  ORF Transcript_15829/g.32426 Transcript_15829/m.32426 type:complete len:81 (+) Transcript_15829:198-440(+)
MSSSASMNQDFTNNNNGFGMPQTASEKADEAFLGSLPPEFIVQQERIMNQIEEKKARGGRVAGTKSFPRQALSIRYAVYC